MGSLIDKNGAGMTDQALGITDGDKLDVVQHQQAYSVAGQIGQPDFKNQANEQTST